MQIPNDVEWYERVSDVEHSIAMAAIVPALDAEKVRAVDDALHHEFRLSNDIITLECQ